MAGVEGQDTDEEQPSFVFRYPSNGRVYELKVPIKIPYSRDVRELAVRLIRGHDLPCYLEDQLIDQLRCHVQETTQSTSDSNATETMQRVLDEDKVMSTTGTTYYHAKHLQYVNYAAAHSVADLCFGGFSGDLICFGGV